MAYSNWLRSGSRALAGMVCLGPDGSPHAKTAQDDADSAAIGIPLNCWDDMLGTASGATIPAGNLDLTRFGIPAAPAAGSLNIAGVSLSTNTLLYAGAGLALLLIVAKGRR